MSSRSGQSKDKFRVMGHNDPISNAQTVIGPIHRRVHAGELYSHSLFGAAIGPFGQLQLRIANASSLTYHLQVRAAMGGISGGRLQIFEDSDLTAGTAVVGINHNRTTAASPPDIKFDSTHTVTAVGTLLFDTVIPAVSSYETEEWLMDPTGLTFTDALIILTNADLAATLAGSITANFYQDSSS